MSNKKKRYLFNVELDPELQTKLLQLAQATDRDRTAYIRHVIRRDWDAKFGQPTTTQQTTPQQ